MKKKELEIFKEFTGILYDAGVIDIKQRERVWGHLDYLIKNK